MTDEKHTPLPWRVVDGQVMGPHTLVAAMHGHPHELEDALHIAKCVNTHADLLATCEAAYKRLRRDCDPMQASPEYLANLRQLAKAIAKAKGDR